MRIPPNKKIDPRNSCWRFLSFDFHASLILDDDPKYDEFLLEEVVGFTSNIYIIYIYI